MSASTSRRAVYLEEMGISPLWKSREHTSNAAGTESTSVPVEENNLVENVPVPAEEPVTLYTDWTSLESAISGCTACGLCRGRTRVVPGVGDRKAAWLFVGEGPGFHEDQQGEPFVGRSGQLLDNMMRAMGLRRGENTYIANIVKCRPTDDTGKDRPPSLEEASTCRTYLDSQIALIEPRIIIALGRTAAVSLLNTDPQATLASLRGKVHSLSMGGRDIPLIATYHPAYLLRNPISKRQAWADLCRALTASDTP